MAINREDIRKWFRQGKKQNATHMIVVCDTWDYEDYPVYVSDGENAHAVYEKYRMKDMQKVMEVYSLKKEVELQLNEYRAFHFD